MEELNPEIEIHHRIISENPQRRIISELGDSTWGQYIIPGRDETTEKSNNGFRIVLFGSYLLGYLLLETLKKLEEHNPGRLNICGLVTDDPADPNARISVKRRIWRLYGDGETVRLETAMMESALRGGIPVYSGAVKTNYFRTLLQKWNPDAILVCVFGQIIDSPIIDFPAYGIYNFHPADLKSGFGAGPQPFMDLINRDAKTSKFTIHQLTEVLDSGPVVGQSSPINVRFKDGSITDNILVLDDKMLMPIDVMGTEFAKTLVLKKEEGLTGKINHLDFSKHFTPEYRKKLMEPVKSHVPSNKLPRPSRYVDYTI